MRTHSLPTILLAAGIGLLSACASSTRSSLDPAAEELRDEQGWLRPSPALASRIELRANEAEFVKTDVEFIELYEWFCGVGEPAFPTLLDMAASESIKTREVAFASIARLRDPRLLGPLKARVQEPTTSELSMRAAWGRALLGMSDIEGVPAMVDAMELLPNANFRAHAYRELIRHVTDNGIPFDPHGTELERSEGANKWREWYRRMRTRMEPTSAGGA